VQREQQEPAALWGMTSQQQRANARLQYHQQALQSHSSQTRRGEPVITSRIKQLSIDRQASLLGRGNSKVKSRSQAGKARISKGLSLSAVHRLGGPLSPTIAGMGLSTGSPWGQRKGVAQPVGAFRALT